MKVPVIAAAATTAAADVLLRRTARSRPVATLGPRGRGLSIRAIFIERRTGGHVWIYVDRLRCLRPKNAGCATSRRSAKLLLDASGGRREEDERQDCRERHRAYKHGREGSIRRRGHRTFHSHRGCGRWASRARKRHRSIFVVTSRSAHRQCLHDMWGADRYGPGGRHHRPAGRNDQQAAEARGAPLERGRGAPRGGGGADCDVAAGDDRPPRRLLHADLHDHHRVDRARQQHLRRAPRLRHSDDGHDDDAVR
ncbi:PREDICTED: uncharacterized protein LOC106745013 isoform X2 [Dinoponera quadriceps]|uniref:Uncharacterized protein LOC106745013 isoform X2 n=1 Tax=Dinoponera quadriceps TaxID=609295 RepID=A0A6P3XBS3_DINQU|nr:PREDICTED: uncharacterized protein LOC106745013 isoform X2 [Dinoponera quadriceps]